jgi:predicted transcriptional regulator
MEGDEDGSREKRIEKRFGVRSMWKGRVNERIAKEEGRSRKTVKQIVEDQETKKRERKGPSVYEPYRTRVEELLEENEQVPSKQRSTVSKIYKIIRAEG